MNSTSAENRLLTAALTPILPLVSSITSNNAEVKVKDRVDRAIR
jgi:hypothetical protein